MNRGRQLVLPHLPLPRRRTGDDRSRYEQVVRILRLMQRIDGRPFCPPLRTLAADLGVCDRTVRRYLDVLSVAGLSVPPLFTEYERDGAR